MHHQLFLLTILLNCLLIKSQKFPNSYIRVNLNFYYSYGASSGSTKIPVTTRLIPKDDANDAYFLMGQVINGYTLRVNAINCTNFKIPVSRCRANSDSIYLFVEHLLSVEQQSLLQMEDRNYELRQILRFLSSRVHEENEFNLTCIIYSNTNNNNNNNRPKDPYTSTLSATSLFGIIFLSACVIIVLGLCVGWFAIIYYRQCRQHRIKKKLRKALAKSTEEMLAKSPIITFDANNKDISDDDPMCAICLDSFKDQEKIRKLDVCSHYFHITCIDPWLLSHQSCPLCNRNILHNSIPSISSTIMATANEQNNDETTTVGINNNNNQTNQAQN